jgi:JAB-like toxin  1
LQLPRRIDGKEKAYTSIGEQSVINETDYFKLFKFMSDSAFMVEFSLDFYKHNGKSWIELGTYHDRQTAPVAGVNRSSIYKTYHSHSDTEINVKIERHSMGDRGDNWPYGYPMNDFNNTMYYKYPHPNYVYFPFSGRMYNVTQKSIDYVKKIRKSSDF